MKFQDIREIELDMCQAFERVVELSILSRQNKVSTTILKKYCCWRAVVKNEVSAAWRPIDVKTLQKVLVIPRIPATG
jgi:hypothetical protein